MTKAILFTLILWAVFFTNLFLPFDLNRFGLIPRTFTGLLGIVTMPFLHASFWHLASNTVPLVILLTFLYWTYEERKVDQVIIVITVIAGALLWLFGRSMAPMGNGTYEAAKHIGASGLIYGLFAYCFFSSLRNGKIGLFVITLLLFAMNYGSIISGMLPGHSLAISWDGHLTGALAGAGVAFTETDAQGT